MSLTSTPTNALARAEEEIHQQMVLLSSLCARRNLLLPVFCLPPETLASIFIYGAREYHESDEGGYFTPCIPTWVNVSYVCCHWRNVALNCSALWTYHFNVSPRWTEELLLRSKQASLKISCIYSSSRSAEISWWPSLLNNLQQHSERIQILRLYLPPSVLPVELSLRAVHLEKLEICIPNGFFKWSIAITDGDKLHTLRVENCSLLWLSLNLRRLKILSLRFVYPPPRLNMIKYLTALSSMHDLTVLDLEYVLPSARDLLSSGTLDTFQKINFPRLTLLRVFAPLSAVVALLSCVNILPGTQLDLRPRFESGPFVAAYAQLSSLLAQQFKKQPSGSAFGSLVVVAGNNPKLAFSLQPEPLSPPNEVDYNTPLNIVLSEVDYMDPDEMRLPESDKYRIISDILGSLSLTNIQSFHVIRPHLFSSEFWREILGYLDNLRYLKLSGGFMPDLSLHSLTACMPKETSDGKMISDEDSTFGRILVPALEEMELECITFTQGEGRMCHHSLFCTLYPQGTPSDHD